MPKTLVIGDLHGRYEVAEAALSEGFPVVFVGDYLDSITRSIEDQIKTLRIVLEGVREGKAVALKGNHETSYLIPEIRGQISGWKPATQLHVNHIDTSPLLDYYWCEGFLITHAGVSNKYIDMHRQVFKRKELIKTIKTLEDHLDTPETYEDTGFIRGGIYPYGGLRWGDLRDFEPIPSVNQIFGHSRGTEIREIDNNWCIDVLENFKYDKVGLLIEDGEAEIYEF